MRPLAAALGALTLAGCPAAPPAPPAAPTVPSAVTRWLRCAQADDYHPETVEPSDGGAAATATLFTPSGGRLTLTLAPAATGGLRVDGASPARFADAQRLVAAAERCGPLTPGPALRAAFASGAADAPLAGFAARLVVAACRADDGCPEGWRARLLELARRAPEPAPAPRGERCLQEPPRGLRGWVLGDLGPAPGQDAVAWAMAVRAAGLGSGEAILRARFDALLQADDPASAGALVLAAGAALEERGDAGTLSERLRYDGAQALLEAGDARARALLDALARAGRTIYAEFAREDLARLGE